MNRLVINIYDYFRKHPVVGWGLFVVSTVALICSVLTLSYKEDISDFLPLDEDNHTALSVYQDISGANNIYAIIASKDSTDVDQELLVEGVENLVGNIEEMDSLKLVSNIMTQVDMDKMIGLIDEVYQNIPMYLTEDDYARIDSLMAASDFVAKQIAQDKEMLLFPSSNLISANISRDPLNLFTPVLNRLQNAGMSIEYETYDSYILSPDGTKAIAIITSSFGANESENNSKLVDLLNSAAAKTKADNANLDIHVIGGPAIAVSNANQIKKDSILAVCIAGILILALLIYVFRNARNILLIVVSVGWGWLFAMGGLALYYNSVSIIVIGIASVILGIAINYPLHLIDHLKDSEHPRAALKEIISPLVIGNITTVGAFLCLVPLNSPALHDLGLFASLLLVGTILFVLIFLPHAVKTRSKGAGKPYEPKLITKIAGISLENQKWLCWAVAILTVIFGYFSLKTEFDSDMRNINYMTDEQKADFDYFAKIFNKPSDTETVYIVSSGKEWDEALAQNALVDKTVQGLVNDSLASRNNAVSNFLIPQSEQSKRLERWNAFIAKYQDRINSEIKSASKKEGFSDTAFEDFNEIMAASYNPMNFTEMGEIANTVFVGNISEDASTGRKSIVQTLQVKPSDIERVKDTVKGQKEFGGLFFDVKSMNGSIANTLSDDFNYIGIACGCIVFLFLWFSFASLELAIVSFIPMAVSWLWILGIMSILGIKFNIVNVILATFIFGQGDDYTIFMTEGLSYEFAYRKKLLASYKNSIVVSALIMFIGIGTLIFAKHPALRSLGEVTVVGMLSVVLMAYLFPPLVFNWLVKSKGKVRFRPITIKKILCTAFNAGVFFLQLPTAYILGFFLFVLTKPTPKKRLFFHRYNCSVFRFDIKRMAGIRFRYSNPTNEDFEKPAIIICNHQSILDSFCMMFVSPKIILVANEHIRVNPIIRVIFKWCNYISIAEGADNIMDKVKPLVDEGYSIAIFPEGERPEEFGTNIKRFHKGAFFMADALNLDIVPIYFGGVQQLMPKGSPLSNGGPMYIEIGQRITNEQLKAMGSLTAQTKEVRQIYKEKIAAIDSAIFTPKDLKAIVFDRYRYKGREIEKVAQKMLGRIVSAFDELKAVSSNDTILVVDKCGQGELALMLSLMYPEKKIFVHLTSAERREIMEGCIADFTKNVEIVNEVDLDQYFNVTDNLFLIFKKGDERKGFPNFTRLIEVN